MSLPLESGGNSHGRSSERVDRIEGETGVIVDILVSSQSPEHRLPEQAVKSRWMVFLPRRLSHSVSEAKRDVIEGGKE